MELAMDARPNLMERMRRGEAEAFREFVEMHKKRVFTLAYRLTGSVPEAEDLSQETFIKAYRSIARFRGESGMATWLHRITVNLFIDERRKLARRMERGMDELDERRIADEVADGPEAVARNRQLQAHIVRALDGLSGRERQAFVMRHFEEQPLTSIAATMNVAEGTVKSLVFRALQKMRRSLHDIDEAGGRRQEAIT
jgi:RNA polymerase sigma-70 factor, ECF subfamily